MPETSPPRSSVDPPGGVLPRDRDPHPDGSLPSSDLSGGWTAKILRNKEDGTDCTRGVSRAQRAINRRAKIELSLLSSGISGPKRSSNGIKGGLHMHRIFKRILKEQRSLKAWDDAEDKRCAAEAKVFFILPDRVVSATTFVEKPFGYQVARGEVFYQTSAHGRQDLSSIIVSLALFDGDKMLFACSGIALPCGTSETQLDLTRFVTSARLVREFIDNRTTDDQLRIEVRLPDNTTTNGLLGLYDQDIAIVTSLGFLRVDPLDLDIQATHISPDYCIQAVGRAFKLGGLMAIDGSLSTIHVNTWVPVSEDLTEGVLGGPLIGDNAEFLGTNLDLYHHGDVNVTYARFLPRELLYERLNHFQILDPKELHFCGYTLPSGVSSVPPSGFMKMIRRIKSLGYPMPPPLVLELNGQLRNKFEGYFGELRAWKGHPIASKKDIGECVWSRLRKKVFTDISRRVVSFASFHGQERSFACTGLLIKWHGSRAMHTVILTSASWVRSHYNEHDNGYDLKIEVFLPPNQRRIGRLEFYDLNYNVAIVSVQKYFHAIHPEDIFKKVQKSSKKVVAIGRDTEEGLLMATIGEVKHRNNYNKLDCKDLKLSTCKIAKAGIGGPLIDFRGSFVGMNFYDGSGVPPFLPKSKIVKILRREINLPLPSERCFFWGYVSMLTGFLFYQLTLNYMLDDRGCEYPIPMHVKDVGLNRWPVPEPYWYHGALDVDKFFLLEKLPGRTLQ